jgi:hypothetical protein
MYRISGNISNIQQHLESGKAIKKGMQTVSMLANDDYRPACILAQLKGRRVAVKLLKIR